MLNESTEQAIENSPKWLKTLYVFNAKLLKQLLKTTGILPILDKKAKNNPTAHYIRSLFSIHQLDDMIQLDVPWWTYSAIEAISHYIENHSKRLVAFEYGSGSSTFWLAKRCEQVISIEHDPKWYHALNHELTKHDIKNVTLHLEQPSPCAEELFYHSQKERGLSFKSYVNAITKTKQLFDIIIIDGRCRAACLQTSLPFLKQNGIIIFDNSNRKRYQYALEQTKLMPTRFYDRVPGSPFKSETAILCNRCL